MSDTVIRVEGLGKKYSLKHQQEGRQYKALRDVIADGAKSLARPILGKGSNTQNPNREDFWALKDIDFEIKQGDRVGIIGRNGAGKSTLLKTLSRIVEPTEGRISIKGRVASLLEVGTGFHPELTGRENIYLNGAILGMGKAEIKRKFDEIVDFAEVEKFLDTPVKRYSSGMYVRLAFAVAAHLEPEILIVDEVLAVGDAQFQKKCLGKMENVSKEGRTILFVSHNIGAIHQLTNRCLFLSKGKLIRSGLTKHITTEYMQSGYEKINSKNKYIKHPSEYNEAKKIEFCEIKICPGNSHSVRFEISYVVHEPVQSVVAVKVTDTKGVVVTTVRDTDNDPALFVKETGKYIAKFDLPTEYWLSGTYFLTFSLADMTSQRFETLEDILSFEVDVQDQDLTPGWSRDGILLQRTEWNIRHLEEIFSRK